MSYEYNKGTTIYYCDNDKCENKLVLENTEDDFDDEKLLNAGWSKCVFSYHNYCPKCYKEFEKVHKDLKYKEIEKGVNDMLNKITLGDSYELIKKLEDNSVDCVYIDVPYLYSGGYGKHNNNCGVGVKKEVSVALSSIIKGVDYSIYNELIRVMKKINIFIWCSKEQIIDTLNFFAKDNNCNFDILIWHKNNSQPLANNMWLTDFEYCLYFREKGVKLNDGYHLKSKLYQSSINQKDKVLYDHPTIKPLDLVKRHLQHATQENDIVLDCFSGSGTTAVACKELNRQFIAFEIDEEYHRISVDRLNGISVKDRKDKENGIQNIFDFGVDI